MGLKACEYTEGTTMAFSLFLSTLCFSVFNVFTSFQGNGPPLVFSTGLFNTMPSFLYQSLFRELSQNFTIVTTRETIGKNTIEEIAARLSVDKVGLFIHSSFDPDVLNSPFLKKAVLCDPITIPKFDFEYGFKSADINATCDVLVVRAMKAYEPAGNANTIPDLNTPILTSDNSSIVLESIDGVGHPDILDDFWADLASHTNFWATTKDEVLAFEDWARGRFLSAERDRRIWSRSTDAEDRRNVYRKRVSELISQFFLE